MNFEPLKKRRKMVQDAVKQNVDSAMHQGKEGKARLIGIIIICLVLVVGGGKLIAKKIANMNKADILPPLVQSMVIGENGGISDSIYPGEVCSQYENQLAFQVAGKVTKCYVEVGDEVTKGTLLAELDTQDYAQAASIAATSIEQAQLAVANAELQYELAKDNFEKVEILYQNEVASKTEYDNAKNTMDKAAVAVKQANASVTQAGQAHTQTTNQLSYCKLYAAESGVVSSVLVEEGQIISAGQPAVSLVKNDALDVEFSVPENKLDSITENSGIRVSFWALPDVELKATVREVSPVANPVSRTYTVKASLENPDEDVKVGMSASVQMLSTKEVNDIFVPVSVLYQEGDTPAVWIVEENTVTLRPVSVGDFNGNLIQVTDGLEPGERIVTAGVHRLSEGMEVRLETEQGLEAEAE